MRTVGILALLGVAVLFLPAGLRAYAGWFRVDDPAPADAIVLLLGGESNRPERAAELFREGIAPVILLGDSGRFGKSQRSETGETVRILIAEGVPAEAIRVLPPPVVTSTFMEARAVRNYAVEHSLKRIVVVTTTFHTRRARWIFRRTLKGLPIDVRAAAARHPQFDESDWFHTDEGLVTYLDESIKTIYYWIVY